MSDLLSNCCAADFDAFGYEKENGVWQERCLKCGKLCEPIMLGDDDIDNIHRCLKWNTVPTDDKPEKHYCSNCMVGSNVVNVPKSECECDCHEPEKIEKLTSKVPLDKLTPELLPYHNSLWLIAERVNQVIDWINNHEREE